ncbi:hypothetical protein VIN7_8160 [Saccharomyces cerevisiae x Saccharomyces kudriavzevii VIN7]|uniref:Uncharacterized protein n=1 Tax=Saccharomyces cerevisiae x Saccharomyces kudriavzevii (strain VIN7) TaxID=1095631 RepID=H0GX76_SACCK|nr:hypothetical protein VIN7_8160 [Saccharomyces cerevisiae x Saccharomyces kudriavzevii VIN7]
MRRLLSDKARAGDIRNRVGRTRRLTRSGIFRFLFDFSNLYPLELKVSCIGELSSAHRCFRPGPYCTWSFGNCCAFDIRLHSDIVFEDWCRSARHLASLLSMQPLVMIT